MGIAQGNIDTAVTVKGTGGILVLKDARQWQPHACIRVVVVLMPARTV